jgi:hypothetical protein
MYLPLYTHHGPKRKTPILDADRSPARLCRTSVAARPPRAAATKLGEEFNETTTTAMPTAARPKELAMINDMGPAGGRGQGAAASADSDSQKSTATASSAAIDAATSA